METKATFIETRATDVYSPATVNSDIGQPQDHERKQKRQAEGSQ